MEGDKWKTALINTLEEGIKSIPKNMINWTKLKFFIHSVVEMKGPIAQPGSSACLANCTLLSIDPECRRSWVQIPLGPLPFGKY